MKGCLPDALNPPTTVIRRHSEDLTARTRKFLHNTPTMVFHRDQSHFVRARWRRAVLGPFWLAQVVFLLALMGIFAYRLADTVHNYEQSDKKGEMPMVEVV